MNANRNRCILVFRCTCEQECQQHAMRESLVFYENMGGDDEIRRIIVGLQSPEYGHLYKKLGVWLGFGQCPYSAARHISRRRNVFRLVRVPNELFNEIMHELDYNMKFQGM